MRRLLVLTIALIVYGSLYPWQFDFSGPARQPLVVLMTSWPAVWDRFALRDAVINVLLYLPFGAAALCVLARRFPGAMGIAPILFGGMALSTTMELLQVYDAGRVCSLFDVLCNTIGAGAGATVALAFGLARARPVRGAVRMGGWLLLIAFAGHQLYPFFPIVSTSRLHHALGQLASMSDFSLTEVWCCGAEWFAAMAIAGAMLQTARGTALEHLRPTMLLLALPVRLVVVTRSLALHEVIGAALATILWIALADRFRVRAGIWIMASALLLRELAPFHFTSTPTPFDWIPFVPTLVSERQSALVILLRKAFDYGAMVWLLTEHGVSFLSAGAVVAASLAVLEGMQCYLPGRTPETTDAVLASLMTLILWSLQNFERREGLA